MPELFTTKTKDTKIFLRKIKEKTKFSLCSESLWYDALLATLLIKDGYAENLKVSMHISVPS